MSVALHEDMAVDADDLVQQFVAEAVHHRHDDDQRRDPEQDAQAKEKPAITETKLFCRGARR